MADVLLDAIYDVTKVALRQNNMFDQIVIVKDHANFRIIVKLKNWATLQLEDQVDSDDACDSHMNEEACHSGQIFASAIIKEELADETIADFKSSGCGSLECEPTPPTSTPLIASHSPVNEGS